MCVQRWSSAHLGYNKWLFELLLPFCHLEPAWPFSSDLWHRLFLLNIGIGALIGIVSFAKLVSILLADPQGYTYVPTFALFLGLIIGSLPILISLQKDTKFTALRFFLLILGTIGLVSVAVFASPSGITPEEYNLIHDFGIFKIVTVDSTRGIWLFLIGIIAGFTMIIPGASGSAVLVALGEYQHIMGYISERSILHIFLVCLGAAVGIYVSTLAMAKLFEKRPGGTFYFVLGLVFASCIQLIIQMINSGAGLAPWLIAVPMFIIGISLAFFPARSYHISKQKEEQQEQEQQKEQQPQPVKPVLTPKEPIKNTVIKSQQTAQNYTTKSEPAKSLPSQNNNTPRKPVIIKSDPDQNTQKKYIDPYNKPHD